MRFSLDCRPRGPGQFSLECSPPAPAPKATLLASGSAGVGLGAVPQAGAAVHALFAVEQRGPGLGVGGNGLPGAGADADLLGTGGADRVVLEAHMVGVAGRGLDLAAQQQRGLVRHQKLAVVFDLRPAHAVHHRVVQAAALGAAGGAQRGHFRRRDAPLAVALQGGMRSWGRLMAGDRFTEPPVSPVRAMPTSPWITPHWKPSRDFLGHRASCSTQERRRRAT
jgi:hypothetical protein